MQTLWIGARGPAVSELQSRLRQLGYDVGDARHSIEALSEKVGAVLLVLGGMHFFNLFVFSRIRRRARLAGAPPPLAPSAQIDLGELPQGA